MIFSQCYCFTDFYHTSGFTNAYHLPYRIQADVFNSQPDPCYVVQAFLEKYQVVPFTKNPNKYIKYQVCTLAAPS